MKIFKYLTIIFFILNCTIAYSKEIVIKFKIGKNIITNKDIENEKKYLISLNNDLLKISKIMMNFQINLLEIGGPFYMALYLQKFTG